MNKNNLFLIYLLIESISGYNNPEYSNLSDQEKRNMDFVDKCLYQSDDKISKASSEIMFLILEYFLNYDNKPMSDDVFFLKKHKIMNGLSEEEMDIINEFGRSFINTLGIYSEERVLERKLKRDK